jgi:hypothetical protein
VSPYYCCVTGVRAGIDVVAADAKFLRAKAEEYAVDAKNILTQDVQELESLVQHRGTLLLVSRLSWIPVRRSSCTWVTVFNCVWLRSSEYALLELLVAGLNATIVSLVACADLIVLCTGKELWWLFQPLDSALEGVMNKIDAEFGAGMGSKVSSFP